MLDLARVLALTEQRTMVVPRPHPVLVTRRVLVMERLRGFAFDDVASMHDAGLDTTKILRAGLIACLEGALLHGVFHGDLHGGNLLVQPDGRTVLFDFGITGRLDEPKRLAFLRLLITGTAGDVRGQLAALRDLGAFPADTDLDAVFVDLELDQPVKDPTQMSADEMVDELQDLVKKLLGLRRAGPEGPHAVREEPHVPERRDRDARARSRPARRDRAHPRVLHPGPRRAHRPRDRPRRRQPIDLDAVKASFLVPPEVDRLTFRELQERRRTILQPDGRGASATAMGITPAVVGAAGLGRRSSRTTTVK